MPLLAVNHHYFRDAKSGQGIYPTTPAELSREVQMLRSKWRIGREADIVEHCSKDDCRDPICILTFDDGLKEQMRTLNALDAVGASALYFVPTAPLLRHEVLDVHKLHMIRSRLSDEEVAFGLQQRFSFDEYKFDEGLLSIQYRYDRPISQKVKYFLNFVLEPEARIEWTTSLFVKLFGSECEASRALYMNEEDLQILGRRHILGSHAHSHVPLTSLSFDQAKNEIEESVEILGRIAGRRPIGISYPFGGKSAVSEAVFKIAQKAGLIYGFTMERGINSAGIQNPLALKRIDTNDVSQWIECGEGV